MDISRTFAMPSSNTFSIQPIKNLIGLYLDPWSVVADPFCGDASFLHDMVFEQNLYANDLNPNHHPNARGLPPMCASEYLDMFSPEFFDRVIFDPPYSLRQLKECYDGFGKALTQDDTQYFFSNIRDQIAEVTKVGGYVLSFGWASHSMGKKRGFEIEEILIVNHGGNHHDTIVTVEKKVRECD